MLAQYYRISQAAGINIHINAESSVVIDGCLIAAEKDRLDFTKKITGLTSVKDLSEKLPAKALIALNITGKGVLVKQLNKVPVIDQTNFSQVLPNGNMDDFYVQDFISGEQSFVAILRKAEADKWLDALQDLGFQPLTLSLGPAVAEQINPQLNNYGDKLVFNGHEITLNEKREWLNYQYKEGQHAQFELKVDSELLDESLLLPYAAAFQLLLSTQLDLIAADTPELEAKRIGVIETQKLKVNSAIVLAVTFVLLLVNFLLFSSLSAENMQLAGQLSSTAQTSSDAESLNETIAQKELLLKNLGWEGGIRKSTYIAALAQSLPHEITWTQVSVNPVDIAATKIEKTTQFDDHRIRITGLSQNIIPVNEWVARVKINTWVKSIRLENYAYNNELETGQFTVLIDYK